MTDGAPGMEDALRAFEREASGLRADLHRYCARMVGSAIDGEDVLQDALAKGFVVIRKDGPPDMIRPWLFRIAHNCALDFLRARARMQGRMGEIPLDTIVDESASADTRISVRTGFARLMALPATQRGVIVLRDVLGYSLQEIGVILDMTETAAKGVLQRGRDSLRRCADDQPDSPTRPEPDPDEVARLGDYVAAFNARDFDRLRVLLADDVKLELVNRLRADGVGYVGNYFGRYAGETHWHFAAGTVEGRPAILVTSPEDPVGAPRYFILIGWKDGRIVGIRDFLFADYVMDGLEFSRFRPPERLSSGPSPTGTGGCG